MTNINEKTNIPLFAVVTAVASLVVGVVWVVGFAFSVEAKADKALELGQTVKLESKEDRQILREVHDDVIDIKGYLKIQQRRK